MRKLPEIVVAVDCCGGFGKAGKIPWHLPEDFKHFKELTKGSVCVMGKNTYTDMLEMRKLRDAKKDTALPIGEILPGRESFVLTRDQSFQTPGAVRVDSLGQVMNQMTRFGDERKLFVLGGKRLFIEALAYAENIHMTIIKGNPYDCDVVFPIEVVNKSFAIESGKETDSAYYVVYKRK